MTDASGLGITLNLDADPTHLRDIVRFEMERQRPRSERSIREEEVYGAVETFLSDLARETMFSHVVSISTAIHVEPDDLYISMSVSTKPKAEAESTDTANSAEPQGGES